MKLTIFGATGQIGQSLVDQALAQDHDVVAFTRTPSEMEQEHERLQVVEGDIREAEKVEEAIKGADAVLSALRHTDESSKNILTIAARYLIRAMKKQEARRLISLVGMGVGDPKDPLRPLGERVVEGLLDLVARDRLEDAERHAELIRESDLDWTLVRTPRLTNGPHTGHYRTGYFKFGPLDKISRADVADFMLGAAVRGEYVRETPMVSY